MKGVLNRHVVRADQSIFREGELGNTIYVIERGSVLIWRGTKEHRVEIAVIPKGGVFGEMAIFDGKPRMASATSLEETVLLQIDGTHVREALKRADPVIDKLLRVILESARDLASQLQKLHNRAENLERALAGRPVPSLDDYDRERPTSE